MREVVIPVAMARKFLARLGLLLAAIVVLAVGWPEQEREQAPVVLASSAQPAQPVSSGSSEDEFLRAVELTTGKVLAEDGSAVPESFYDEPVRKPVAKDGSRKAKAERKSERKVQAVDGTYVPESFYDKPVKPRKSVVAEDGSRVKPGFYDRTDYNRNGVADQDEGFGRNPDSDDVKAGRK